MSETFINGSGTRVNLPKDAGPNPEVTAVEVKERESSFAFTPLERGKWSVSTSSSAAGPVTVVVTKNPYPAIKVFYTRNSTREEVADVLSNDVADGMAAQAAQMEAQSKAILKDLQFDKINLEGVSTKNFEGPVVSKEYKTSQKIFKV